VVRVAYRLQSAQSWNSGFAGMGQIDTGPDECARL